MHDTRERRIGLVGCVKQKTDSPQPAATLYTSTLFKGRVRYVERSCGRWFVLWYRGFQAEGNVATVSSVEVDRDAVVLGLNVSRRANGARPAPPQQLHQVATIDGGEIVDIRFYPDRASALARDAQVG